MKLIKDSVIYVVGEIASKAVPFFLLPYLTHTMGANLYGDLSYYQVYIAILIALLGLSQDTGIARYYYFYGKKSVGCAFIAGVIYSLSLGIPIIIFCLYQKSLIFALITCVAISTNLISVQLALSQCQKKAISYTVIQFSVALINVLLTILLFQIFADNFIVLRIVAQIIANLFIAICAFYFLTNGIRIQFIGKLKSIKKSFMYLFSYGFPLLLHQISALARNQIDRIFIFHYFSASALGVYSAGWQIALVFNILIMAINKATLPYIYESFKRKTLTITMMKKWFWYSFFIPIPVLLITYYIPDDIWVWFLGGDFQGVRIYIFLFMITSSLFIPYLFLANILFYYGRTKSLSICSTLSVVIYIGALILLLQLNNVTLVPLASIISSVLILPLLYVSVRFCERGIIQEDFANS